VIGGGTAGTMAALTAAEGGANVLLLEKAHVRHSGALAMGMDGYVSKPFQAHTLFREIAEVLTPGEPGSQTDVEQSDPHHPDKPISPGETMPHPPEFLKELAHMFLEDAPRLMLHIRNAIEDRNASDLKLAAHTLKGSVGVFKDQPAFDAAFQMERIGRDADWENAESVWTTLTAEIKRLTGKLTALVSPGGPAGIAKQK